MAMSRSMSPNRGLVAGEALDEVLGHRRELTRAAAELFEQLWRNFGLVSPTLTGNSGFLRCANTRASLNQ